MRVRFEVECLTELPVDSQGKPLWEQAVFDCSVFSTIETAKSYARSIVKKDKNHAVRIRRQVAHLIIGNEWNNDQTPVILISSP